MLKDLILKGASARKNNPELKFLERPDELGNPKQLKVLTPSKLYWDPYTSELFKSIASFAVLIKRQKPGRASFMEAFAWVSDDITSEVSRSQRKREIKKQVRQSVINARLGYYRRQSRKLKNQ
jgi:uncharacterized UPF0160 family protein